MGQRHAPSESVVVQVAVARPTSRSPADRDDNCLLACIPPDASHLANSSDDHASPGYRAEQPRRYVRVSVPQSKQCLLVAESRCLSRVLGNAIQIEGL